jgi:hypothetical protein
MANYKNSASTKSQQKFKTRAKSRKERGKERITINFN